MNWNECWLRGYQHACGGKIERHHILNHSKFPGWRKYSAKKAALDLLVVPVCSKHNAWHKTADTPKARKILTEKLIQEYGEEWVRWAFDQILNKTKVRKNYSDLEFDAVMAYEVGTGKTDFI